MPILAINTAANFVSLALLENERVLATVDSRIDFQPTEAAIGQPAGFDDQMPTGYAEKKSKRGQNGRRVFPAGASVMLAPMIDRLLSDANLQVADLDLIGLAIGPGSFTGLRVGVVTAKSLAYAGKVDLIAVNSLEAIAVAAAESDFVVSADQASDHIEVAINAQRRQLFVGKYLRRESSVEVIGEHQLFDRQPWIDQLPENAILSGTGITPLTELLDQAEKTLHLIPESHRELSATTIGQIAWKKYAQGHRDDFWKIQPIYFRPSAAEERLS